MHYPKMFVYRGILPRVLLLQHPHVAKKFLVGDLG
jgi:hypothetical protein